MTDKDLNPGQKELSEKMIRENLAGWLENPYWAAYYNGAPSDRCREFIALEFRYSEYEDEETGEAMDAAEDGLDTEDLRYLMEHCGNNPRKGILARKIAEKETAGGA